MALKICQNGVEVFDGKNNHKVITFKLAIW